MSYSNAVRQREEMIQEYKRMLASETNPQRIQDIEAQITLCEDQLAQLKTGKPLFGRPKPLVQTTTLIEPDPENKGGQKITILNAPTGLTEVAELVTEVTPVTVSSNSSRRLGNRLRDKRKSLQASAAEDSLKAQIEAAKAAKKV